MFFRLWFHAYNLLYVTSPQKQVTDISLVLKDSDLDSENLSSLIRLSVSDGQNTDSSKVVSVMYIINIDLNDVTNKYYTVLYRTVMLYEKKNRSLVFSGSRKIPTLGSTVQWETRQALFPTGTVGPRVGIFLSPLNTNDGFYLSYPHIYDRFLYSFP